MGVIVVTAGDEDSVRSVAMQNGATAFFAKPFDNKIFLDAIRQAMASALTSRFDLGRTACPAHQYCTAV
jgi:FixJ family two-component response regulator